MKRTIVAVAVVAAFAGACQQSEPIPPIISSTLPPPATTSPPATKPPPTTAAPATTTTTTTTMPPPVTTGAPVGLPSIPVGENGVEYRGSGTEQEITGPRLLAVDPGGGFHVHDPTGGRLWSFVGGETSVIDLVAIDILSLETMAAASDHLILVEIFFAPVRHRVHRLTFDGAILETIELPEGLRLENGLSGITTNPEGDFVLELSGGERFAAWDSSDERFVVSDVHPDGRFKVAPGGAEIDGVFIDAELPGLGGLRYLGKSADETITVLFRDAVIQMSPVFIVLSTVEWYGAGGEFLGSAVVPSVVDQHTSQPPGLAVGPDGRVYALVTRPDVVEVIELARSDERILEL